MLFGSLPSQAEYRVFVLQLVNSKTNVVRQIQTTLDPEQYETYYPHSPDEKLTYVQTWRCRGRTDFLKPHCTPPQKPLTKAQN
ncbi:MAG: hypothetical protein H7328_06175 [Bdellovibrio sp.]|nr:hypothetical protein [Bdellovibrio sp.]